LLTLIVFLLLFFLFRSTGSTIRLREFSLLLVNITIATQTHGTREHLTYILQISEIFILAKKCINCIFLNLNGFQDNRFQITYVSFRVWLVLCQLYSSQIKHKAQSNKALPCVSCNFCSQILWLFSSTLPLPWSWFACFSHRFCYKVAHIVSRTLPCFHTIKQKIYN